MTEPRTDNEHYHDWGGGPRTVRPLRRVAAGRMVAGVAGGLADYLDLDVTLVRIGFVVLTFVAGIGVPAYLACWLLLPVEGSEDTLAEDLFSRVGDFVEDAEDRLRGRAW